MYYPKNKIQENKYTSGGELKEKLSGKNYKGYYFITFDKKYFSGKEFSYSSIELLKNEKSDNSFLSSGFKQYKNNTNNINQIIPQVFLPNPSEKDYEKGFILRYFMKRKNGKNDTIKEISESSYTKIVSNILYDRTQLSWKITGKLKDDLSNINMPVYGIEDTNKRTISSKLKEIPGLDVYLSDLKQFAKIS